MLHIQTESTVFPFQSDSRNTAFYFQVADASEHVFPLQAQQSPGSNSALCHKQKWLPNFSSLECRVDRVGSCPSSQCAVVRSRFGSMIQTSIAANSSPPGMKPIITELVTPRSSVGHTSGGPGCWPDASTAEGYDSAPRFCKRGS